MKHFCAAAGFLLLSPLPALAQVTVNPAALQQLAGILAPPPPAPVAETMAPLPQPVHHWHHAPRLAVVTSVAHAPLPAPVPVAARVPAPAAPKPAPAAPKPVAAISLVFAPGSADLPGNAAAALKPFCTAPGMIAVDAHAPADPSDPSAAMRLSLSRALSIQQALTACGVPGAKILPRADGDVPGQNEDEAVIGGGGKN